MIKKNKFPWKVISTKRVYKNPWIIVREDKIIHPSGENGSYGVVEISPAVGIVPVTKSKKLILLKHWRYPAHKVSIEIPLGGINKDETPLVAAKRELLEETGYKAKKWKFLGNFDSSNCVTNDTASVFLATELYQDKNYFQKINNMTDEGIELMEIPLKEVVNFVKFNKITESISKGAILLYLFKKIK